jgi:hypothetical protein
MAASKRRRPRRKWIGKVSYYQHHGSWWVLQGRGTAGPAPGCVIGRNRTSHGRAELEQPGVNEVHHCHNCYDWQGPADELSRQRACSSDVLLPR